MGILPIGPIELCPQFILVMHLRRAKGYRYNSFVSLAEIIIEQFLYISLLTLANVL